MGQTSVFKEIMREYESDQNAAQNLRERRQAALYKSLPRLRDIDREMSGVGLRLAKLAMSGGKNVADVRASYDSLVREKKGLLAAGGIPDDYLTDIYRCNLCEDTGYVGRQSVNPQQCACFKQRLINRYYTLSNLKDVLAKENFGTFKLSHFSQEKIENEGLSPRDNIKAIHKIAERFVKNFKSGAENLIFYGATGLGKTFICHCIAKALLDEGYIVLYITAPRLFKMIQDNHFNRDNTNDSTEQLSLVQDADLLILDDLGAEFSTIVTDSALFEVINQRLLDKKSTVISTNLTKQEILGQYTERIASRFIGYYNMLYFFGEDIREKKKIKSLE
jgi:DNA replication protein DnaC